MSAADELIATLTTLDVVVPIGLPERDMEAIRDWTRRHGVDPCDVPMPAHIAFAGGLVTFEQIVRDDAGEIVFRLDKNGHPVALELTTITVPQLHPWPYEGSPTPERPR